MRTKEEFYDVVVKEIRSVLKEPKNLMYLSKSKCEWHGKFYSICRKISIKHNEVLYPSHKWFLKVLKM